MAPNKNGPANRPARSVFQKLEQETTDNGGRNGSHLGRGGDCYANPSGSKFSSLFSQFAPVELDFGIRDWRFTRSSVKSVKSVVNAFQVSGFSLCSVVL